MLKIQPAKKGDADLILAYIRKLAITEKFPFEVSVTKKDIEENLFGADPAAEAIICSTDDKPCGLAVFYSTFSTTTGKRGLHLDDLYIEPEHQGKGFGKKVLSYLAQVAIERDCARFEWWALKTNEAAIKFYNGIGARVVDEIAIFRLESEGLCDIARFGINK